jgi:hypothetical protein
MIIIFVGCLILNSLLIMRAKVFLFLIVFIFQLYQLQSQYVQAPYAFWAHSHVIWINKDEQNQT